LTLRILVSALKGHNKLAQGTALGSSQAECTMDKTRRSNREFLNDRAFIVAFRSAKVALAQSNREFFHNRAFGQNLVFDRLKVKVDRLADIQPGLFQSIPFGNATRKCRHVRGVTAFIGWFVHDFESHVRSRLKAAQRGQDSIVVFGRDFRHRGNPSSRRSQSSRQSPRIERLQWGRAPISAEYFGETKPLGSGRSFNEAGTVPRKCHRAN
jgi:hypothetical protein